MKVWKVTCRCRHEPLLYWDSHPSKQLSTKFCPKCQRTYKIEEREMTEEQVIAYWKTDPKEFWREKNDIQV